MFERFGIAQTTVLTALLKGSFFLIGILIIGAFEPRTIITGCGSTLSAPVNVYQFQLWPHIEAYTDYRDLYIPCLIAPFLKGQGLYHLGTIVYNYPPLFLYLISGFALVANIVWLPAVPLVLFDVLTVIPVYLITKEFVFCGNSRMAFLVAMFWAANPINLFYNDLMWLNTAPTTFFLILAVYLFLKQNWFFSSLALAISTGFKQISIVVFPVLLIFLWRATGFSKKLLVYTGAYIASLLLISTPYVFNDTQNYFWSLNFPIFVTPSNVSNSPPQFSSSLSDPVRITSFLGYLSSGMAALVSKSYQELNYVLAASFGTLLVFLIIESVRRLPRVESENNFGQRSPAPKTHWQIFSKYPIFLAKRFSDFLKDLKIKRSFSTNEILVFCLTAFIIFFALFGRGVYKYYFASITPLGIPMFRYKFGAAIFEVFSIVLFLAPREVTPWMAVLLITFVPRMLEFRSEKTK